MPDTKKAAYEETRYVKTLSNCARATIVQTVFYRGGSFEIHLTEEEKNAILKKDAIVLNEYEIILNELYDECDYNIEIANASSYSKDLLDEIMASATNYGRFDTEFMEENDWDIMDTIYGFQCGCVLE
jgi:hypothetical protein